jgi:hypothetical protein
MSKNVFIAALALIIFLGTSYAVFMNPTESTFFSQFSLRKLVEKNKSRAGRICWAGGMGGIGGGGGGEGGREFSHHKGEAFSCQVKTGEGERFSEEELMASIQADVEKDITASAATIIDRGNPDASTFYFVYTVENIQGLISISGKKVRDEYYSLKADLEEKGKKK